MGAILIQNAEFQQHRLKETRLSRMCKQYYQSNGRKILETTTKILKIS